MTMDKTLFKKLYIDYDKVVVVAGYDFLTNKYILKRYNSKRQGFVWNDYIELTNSLEKRLITTDEAISSLDEKIKTLKEVLALYEKFALKCKTYEAKNTVRRLVDTRKYINVLSNTYTKLNGKNKSMYERELQKALKGERRVLKVLFSRLPLEDYEKFLEYVEK